MLETEQQMHLTTEPSLQLPKSILLFFNQLLVCVCLEGRGQGILTYPVTHCMETRGQLYGVGSLLPSFLWLSLALSS